MAAALAGETRDSRLESSRQSTSRQRASAGGWARWTVDGGRVFEDTRRDGGVNSDATVHRWLSGCRLRAGRRWLPSCHQAGSGRIRPVASTGTLEHWNLLTLWRRRSGRQVGPARPGWAHWLGGSLRLQFPVAPSANVRGEERWHMIRKD